MNAKSFRFLCAAALFFSFAPSFAYAQNPGTGSYPFSHLDSFGFDRVNPGNLNVHFEIPVVSKPGRGIPFQYTLEFDGLIWSPTPAGSSSAWTPDPSFGIHGYLLNDGYKGYLSYSDISRKCFDDPNNPGQWEGLSKQSNFAYHDEYGVSHSFDYSYDACAEARTGSGSSGNGSTVDGSGFSYDGSHVHSSSGVTLLVPTFVNGSGNTFNATITDSNGNEVTNDQNGTFTDTMGLTPLTISGTGTPTSPRVFTYSTVGGGTAAITIYYTAITISTTSNCSGVTEYGPQSANLPTSVSLPDGSAYQFGYDGSGRLTSVTLPTGGTISYSYSGGVICADGSPMQLTRSTSVSSDGNTQYVRSNVSATTSHTEITGPHQDQTEIDFVYSAGTPYETTRRVYSGSSSGGNLLARTDTCYNGYAAPSCTIQLLSLPISKMSIYRTLGSYENGSDTSYNAQGLVTDVTEYDYGSSGRGSTLRETTYTYAVLGGYLTDKIGSVKQFDGSGNQTSQTVYDYAQDAPTSTTGLPQHVPVSGPRGNLYTVESYWNSSNDLLTQYLVDDAGQVIQSRDWNLGSTFYAYDSTDTLVTSITPPAPNGVSLASSYTFDPSTGLLENATDANGHQTSYQYDSMLRPTEIDIPGGKSTMGYTPSQQGSLMQTSAHVYQSASAYADTETQYDALGLQARVAVANGQGANPWYQTDTCLNQSALTSFTSYPYQGNGFGSGAVCSGSGGDLSSYDPLGRVTQITHGDGSSITYNYSGRATEVTDENGVTRITQVDGLGRPTIVCEISSNSSMPGSGSPASCGTDVSGTGFTTTYSYAPSTGTTTVTQGSQTRTFRTDWLGRTTSVAEPESGTTTYNYAYTPTGLLVTRSRPTANQPSASVLTTTKTQYDLLGRVVNVTYSDGTPTKTFAYDASANWNLTQVNLAGRLSMASLPGSATVYSYDPLGRISDMDECLPSACSSNSAYNKLLHYAYDEAGNLTSSTDGAGVISTYVVSPAGEVQSLTSSQNDSTDPPNLLHDAQYGAFGASSFGLGNNLAGTLTYDSLGRLSSGGVQHAGNPDYCYALGKGYKFTAAWKGDRLTSSTDTVLNQASTYGYDEFDRLTSRTVTAGTVQNLSNVYDRWGNRTQQNFTDGTGSVTQFQLSFGPATNQVTTYGYGYDAAGNMTSDGAHSYTYDADGNVVQADGGAAQYIYNALNQRVRTVVGSTAREFVFNAAGQRVSIWDGASHSQIQGQYYWGAKPLAFYAGGSTHFQHPDWVGTERMRTTYNGAVDGRFTSLPFGDSQVTTTGSDGDAYHFAGLDYAPETNTGHAQFRQYSPILGRWTSPDPYSGSYDFSNPQSLNRYTYVENSPVAATDVSGLMECDGGPCMGLGGSNAPSDGGLSGGSWTWETVWANQEAYTVYPDGEGGVSIDGGSWGWFPTGGYWIYTAPSSQTSGPGGSPKNAPNNGNKQQIKNCVSNFYNSKLGTAVQFGSPISLLPGWNPGWGNNLKEWGVAIIGKLGGLFGSGAVPGTTQITTLSGTQTVGSGVELATEGGLAALEKVATPAMGAATLADIMAHSACAQATDPAAWNYAFSNTMF